MPVFAVDAWDGGKKYVLQEQLDPSFELAQFTPVQLICSACHAGNETISFIHGRFTCVALRQHQYHFLTKQ